MIEKDHDTVTTLYLRSPRWRETRSPWGDAVPTLATLASPYGLRVYRDACGDENIPGRYGEIFRHGPGVLSVQVGGTLATGKRLTERWKIRWRIRFLLRDPQCHRVAGGKEEALFHFPDRLLPEVATVIQAYRAYRRSHKSATWAEAA